MQGSRAPPRAAQGGRLPDVDSGKVTGRLAKPHPRTRGSQEDHSPADGHLVTSLRVPII
jgi:hypothetical protein